MSREVWKKEEWIKKKKFRYTLYGKKWTTIDQQRLNKDLLLACLQCDQKGEQSSNTLKTCSLQYGGAFQN